MPRIKCLDKGFVELVDHMGSDASIANAARVSYSGKGTKTSSDNRSLINYLIRNYHTSPLEMVEFVFHVKLPIFVARQIVRHRTTSINEISGRYSILQDEFYVPSMDRLRKQSEDNKQGSSNEQIEDGVSILDTLMNEQKNSYSSYETYLSTGMARELARINLPLSTYTEWVWKVDLNNLFKFLLLRKSDHAQEEVRVYADAKFELIKPIVPYACEAFEEHILNGISMGQFEWEFMKQFRPDVDTASKFFEKLGWSKRRIKETITKIYKD